ncbi:MAG: hypothetical protein COA50_15870 [Flavobacteriaceae bacterium]|nr:MAG: hypothetical protein COA50_15870 [Flavobacteriaceae bacterium]
MIMKSSYPFVYDLFMKNKAAPFYTNHVLNALTNTVFLDVPKNAIDLESLDICTVLDVPDYIQVNVGALGPNISMKIVRQNKGFLVNLLRFTTAEAYLTHQLSKRSRKKLRAKKRKLEEDHDISYKFYYGDITQIQYDYLFSEFYSLLKKRFHQKKVYNKNLFSWKKYYELVYPMILDKKASLFVIYDGNSPITITINFHLKDTVFSYIETYDTNYSNYNLGDVSMLKHLEWCLNNGIQNFDLSMGETKFKIKWCNHHYDFKYHIFYNLKSLKSRIKLGFMLLKLKLKQYLRDKNILGKLFRYDKFLYKRRGHKLNGHQWKKHN